MALGTLYICYFGLREPLVQTQVLPYLRELAASGIRVHLLTFEPSLSSKPTNGDLEKLQLKLKAAGISWHFLPYHKRPSIPATMFDITAGALFAARLVRRESLGVLHARAHVPMAMALAARFFTRVKLIFDIRGLMAEEYADAGIWKEGSLPFRLVKRLERRGIRRADQIVVLTKRLRDWLVSRQLKRAEQIEVIPCCVDVARFKSGPAVRNGSESLDGSCFEVIYAGSLIGLYLVEEMGRFFKALKELQPEAFLRILSVSPPEQGAEALKRAGLHENEFEINAVAAADVFSYLAKARLGLSFRKLAFAQIAASPTKIPEYLAAGLPVVCNAGTGDMDALIETEQIGIVLRDHGQAAYHSAARQALQLAADREVRDRCQQVAFREFDLHTVGGPRYIDVYSRIG